MNISLRNIFVAMISLCVQSVVFAASPPEHEGLTEQKILSFIKAQDDAFMQGDIAPLISVLADSYTSTTERPEGKVSKVTRSEFEANLTKNLPQLSNTQTKSEDTKINVSQDGQSASVTQNNNTTFTVGDKNINIISFSTMSLELQGGKIVKTSSSSKILEEKILSAGQDIAERPTDCTYFPEGQKVERYDIEHYHSSSSLGGFFGISNPVPFCRIYKSDAKTVSAIVLSILPTLGNPIKVSDVSNGIFTTDMMERSHLMSKWQDSYSITVQEAKAGEAIVRILRPLSLYESKKFKPKVSDGDNEKWILSKITEHLNSKKQAAIPPSTGAQPLAPTAGATVSIEDQLKKLQDLLDKKIITTQEYKAMRAKALGL